MKRYLLSKFTKGQDDDEFILTKHRQFNPPINILNIYGEIESQSNVKTVEECWNKILDIITKVEKQNEWIVVLGDMNNGIVNGVYGVKGNNDRVSLLVNNKFRETTS